MFCICRTLKEAAKSRTTLTEEVKAKFAAMPSSKEEIQDAISEKELEIENIQVNNPGVKEEFNNRRAVIERTKKALEDQLENVKVEKASIEKDKVHLQHFSLPLASSCILSAYIFRKPVF